MLKSDDRYYMGKGIKGGSCSSQEERSLNISEVVLQKVCGDVS
jgi:hypothetical protein